MKAKLTLFMIAMFCSLHCGCLSIGGKVVNENPETETRLNSLESRVSAIEQATGVRAH